MRKYLLFLLLSLSSVLSAQCLVDADFISTNCLPGTTLYTADFVVQGVIPGTAGTFEVTDIDGNFIDGGEYPGDYTVGPFPLGQDVLLLFADTTSTGCHDTVQVFAPDCPAPECEIITTVTLIECDSVEEAYHLTVLVDNLRNGPNSGWVAIGPQGEQIARPYGFEVTIGFLPLNTPVRIHFQDVQDPECQTILEAQAPDCGATACEVNVVFLENECTPEGDGIFYRFIVISEVDGTWEAPRFNMSGQTNTGQIFRAGPFGADFSGRVTFSVSDIPECSTSPNLPAATCPEFPCFGFAVNAESPTPLFCESGEVWEFMPVNGTYPMSIEIFAIFGERFVFDSLLAPGLFPVFLDAGDYLVVLTDANSCITELEFTVEPQSCSTLRGLSWLDANRNGTRENAENISVSATVVLRDAAGDEIQTGSTDPNGSFFFSNLMEGTYALQFFPHVQEIEATTPNVGDDECQDSNQRRNSFTTSPFEVGSGDQVTCIDAGWIETNCDSLFLSAILDQETNTCGEIPNIIVDYFSPSYPVEILLIGPDGSVLEVQTLEAQEAVTFTPNTVGTFLVVIETTEGCINTVQVDVEETQGLNVTIEQTGGICSNEDPAVLTADVPGVDPADLSYEWSTGETSVSITDLAVNNTYIVTVTNELDGCLGTAMYITFNDQHDSLGFVFFDGPFVIGCDSDSVFVSVDSVREGYEYRWFGPLNQIFEGPGFWAVMPGFYYLEAFSENGCLISGQVEVVSGSLEDVHPLLVVFPNDSICASHNCLRLFWEGPFFGNVPGGVEVLWETPNPVSDSIANANPFGTLCTFYPGLHRVTITTECDTIVHSVVLEDPRGCGSISGQLWLDQGGDCGLDPEDTPVPNYILMLTNDDTGEMYYVMTDANGFWQLEVPEGTYTVAPSLAPGSPFGTCDPAVSVTLGNVPVTGVTVLLPAIASCPQLTTSIGMPFLRRCFNNTLWVKYENRGTATAIDAQVTVVLDDFFELVTVVPAPVSQDGQTFTFNVGDVAPFQSGLIFFQVKVSCEAQIGQNHCVEASITPDAPCDPDPAWDGALVNVDAVGCDGDSVLFRITNIGVEQMSIPLSYVIVEDGIMLFGVPQVNGQLLPDEVMEIMLPANGSTYHVMTNQEPNAPANPEPTAVLEGCNVVGGNGFSTGFGNILNLANGPLTTTTVCRENRGAFDPNDKHGYPLGYGSANYIPEGTRLDYAIRFQNTGTDTAFTVIIRDTIPASLDLATLKLDVSSHPFSVTLDTHRVLSFVFENIQLPDSSVNLAGSQGVVNFSIDHAVDLRPGDVILNEAAIYFDFNEPVITNLSRHTIEKDGLPTGTRNQRAQQVAVGIFPNPSTGRINVRIPDQRMQPDDVLLVTDLYGRQLAKATYATAANDWDVSHLPAGYYLVVVTNEHGQAMGRAGFVMSR